MAPLTLGAGSALGASSCLAANTTTGSFPFLSSAFLTGLAVSSSPSTANAPPAANVGMRRSSAPPNVVAVARKSSRSVVSRMACIFTNSAFAWPCSEGNTPEMRCEGMHTHTNN